MEASREKPHVYLIPVASPIHAGKVKGKTDRVRKALLAGGLRVSMAGLVCSPQEIPDFNPEAYDAIVVFVASGGTSRTLTQIAFGKPWLLLAYPENNSLPSALAAREKLEALGGWRGEIVCSRLEKPPNAILAEARASYLLKTIRASRFLLAAEEEAFKHFKPKLRRLRKVFGLKALPLRVEELAEACERVEDGEVEALKRKLGLKSLKPLKLYLALRRLAVKHQVSAVTIDCFPFISRYGFTPCLPFALLNGEGLPAICEADLDSLPLFLALSKLSGGSLWMANLAWADRAGGSLLLAHCTAPLRRGFKLKNHFETGRGISVDAPLPRGLITLAHFSLETMRLTAGLGELVKSQMGLPGLCRSQALVRVKGNLENLLAHTGNHQLLAPGNHIEVLARMARLVGVEFIGG
ncbi:MAG: hypothetical protein DRO52_03560 [Candidatus Hecatellales archaeon]|nr:MAG: hypothetical protein DRO52_03560 [Candidatus Hecatellales archaeon]